jgi:hypothetical protein
MVLSYAKNALAKLQRDPEQKHRTAEMGFLVQHITKLEAEPTENPNTGMGANNPPAEDALPKIDGRDAIEAHVDGLLIEASNWADGAAIENNGQAAKVATLHRSLQQAAGLVDDNATKEKKPHNDAVTEIAAWQNGFTAKGLKKTPDGKLSKAITATGRLSAAWLTKLDDDRRAREKEIADKAFAAAQTAVSARAEAKETTDLAVMGRAEEAISGAEALLREAKSVANEKVRVDGGEGFRAVTLRSVWHADLIDAPDSWALACGHYKQNPEFMTEFHALIRRWAERDVRIEATRVRGVPGFTFREEKVAA